MLEWVTIALVALALAAGLIVLLSGYFAGHDPASVSTTAPNHAVHRGQ